MIRYVLGIDTSFDDTCVAIYDVAQHKVLANLVINQSNLHTKYGGILPQLAGQLHLSNIDDVLIEALRLADITIQDLQLISYTKEPGLFTCLIVGITFSQALAQFHGIRSIPVNHVHGHIISPFLEHKMSFPYLALSVAGGHTDLYYVSSPTYYRLIGTRLDDAAGECFDKAARILNLGIYGFQIEDAARTYVGDSIYRLPHVRTDGLNFSFSGLKSALARLCRDHPIQKPEGAYLIQKAITQHLIDKLQLAFSYYPNTSVALVGGVACNTFVREEIARICQHHGRELIVPSRRYCSDNGAMIALAGYHVAMAGFEPASPSV